jgi:dihydrolipoamide dehydrogenase
LGIEATVEHIDFGAIMDRMRRIVGHSQSEMRQGIRSAPNLDFYEREARFVDQRTLRIGDGEIKGRHVFIASGARALIPPVEGLNGVAYLTNETVLDLEQRPETIVIIGGGYIGVEFAHFFAAMGTHVTIVQRNDYLAPDEEPEISELLEEKMSQRMDVLLHTEAVKVEHGEAGIRVVGQDVYGADEIQIVAEQLLVAAGRKSNADRLQVENAGIETDEQGYIRVNGYLETNVENVWALGDATGGHMFRHVANREASIAWYNFAHDHRVPMDYSAVPHAGFSFPQIASVGLGEAEAAGEFDILVGQAKYLDVAKGQAMMETDGFAKAIIERESGRILGFHIIGPHAPMLIQEVVDAMANQGTAGWVGQGMRIHPALPELVVSALYNVREPQ